MSVINTRTNTRTHERAHALSAASRPGAHAKAAALTEQTQNSKASSASKVPHCPIFHRFFSVLALCEASLQDKLFFTKRPHRSSDDGVFNPLFAAPCKKTMSCCWKERRRNTTTPQGSLSGRSQHMARGGVAFRPLTLGGGILALCDITQSRFPSLRSLKMQRRSRRGL